MSTYTTPATPNLVATLFGPLAEIIDPLLDDAPDITDPAVNELLSALGHALTIANRLTRGTPAATPAPVRPAAVRTPAARVTVAQVGSVAGAVKPGSLRAKLIGYLAAHPGEAFTVTQLTHATDASSGGAVGAALNTMTAHGEAIQTTDAPKRYTAPAGTTAPPPVPAEPSADTDDEPDLDTAPAAADEPGVDETAAPEPEASTDALAADEPGPDTDQDPAPDADADEQAAPEDAPAQAPQARATRRAKTHR